VITRDERYKKLLILSLSREPEGFNMLNRRFAIFDLGTIGSDLPIYIVLAKISLLVDGGN
jgi:hypothetical protein